MFLHLSIARSQRVWINSKLALVFAGSMGSIMVICKELNEFEDHSLFKRIDRCKDDKIIHSELISPKTVYSGG